jgi:hypothetical protein
MLTSSFALQKSIEKLTVAIKELKDAKDFKKTDKKRMWTIIIGFVLALLFFVVELYLLFYTLKYVFISTPAGPGRNVKIVLLVFFTMPFTLLSAIVDPKFATYVDKH